MGKTISLKLTDDLKSYLTGYAEREDLKISEALSQIIDSVSKVRGDAGDRPYIAIQARLTDEEVAKLERFDSNVQIALRKVIYTSMLERGYL